MKVKVGLGFGTSHGAVGAGSARRAGSNARPCAAARRSASTPTIEDRYVLTAASGPPIKEDTPHVRVRRSAYRERGSALPEGASGPTSGARGRLREGTGASGLGVAAGRVGVGAKRLAVALYTHDTPLRRRLMGAS